MIICKKKKNCLFLNYSLIFSSHTGIPVTLIRLGSAKLFLSFLLFPYFFPSVILPSFYFISLFLFYFLNFILFPSFNSLTLIVFSLFYYTSYLLFCFRYLFSSLCSLSFLFSLLLLSSLRCFALLIPFFISSVLPGSMIFYFSQVGFPDFLRKRLISILIEVPSN